ncbi:FtsH protease activity modulator HflK [Luteolibacter arcticus]|uniref:Protein HflK n=1 Tax=Luteolibacter arcticus TaxID=1581411 RepID=A0ABT3GG21_9BACT|nr:FtsH protease activity modulator HflK [Luteolibacter arcticus]MCW1922519.1 FtsH protease activity modulator HflK [Luteolibacter arcticus]
MPGPPPLSSLRFPKPRFGLVLRLIFLIPLGILLLSGIFSSFYTVSPESVAVIQRFGKFTNVAEPGLHFKIPFGVDTATIVPIRRQLKLEFGFNSPGATNRDQASENPALERDMVTGDLNAAQVEWIVQYGISEPQKYLFHVRDPGPTLRDLTESVMREVIGDRTVDEVLTIGRTEIETESLVKLQKLLEHIEMGVKVEQIQLKNVNPPGPVQHSFEEVNRAQQEREQMINEANGQYNRVIPKARGTAQQTIATAEGYAFRRVNEAQGDVARFQQLLLQYDKAPAITKQRLYLETMNEVLPKLGNKVILDEDAKQFLPLMNLNQAVAPAR